MLMTSTRTAIGAAAAAARADRGAEATASTAALARSSVQTRCALAFMIYRPSAGDPELWNVDCMPAMFGRNTARRHGRMQHRIRSALALACLAGLAALCSAASAPLKVAFVYLGPIADG